VLIAESDNKLLVGLLLAVLVQDTHVCLSAIEGLGSLTETTSETVVHERELQDTLESVENGHLALGGIAGNLNNIGDLGGVVFYVRLSRENVSRHFRFLVLPPPSRIEHPFEVAVASLNSAIDDKRRQDIKNSPSWIIFSCRAILEDFYVYQGKVGRGVES
jgi:hypothetical protein